MGDIRIGQVIELADGRVATVRYVGQPHFAPGDWVGVELEDDTGKNDGSVQGERYFDCEMGKGMFVRPAAVTIIAQPEPKPALKKTARPSSAIVGKRMSSVPDPGTMKRMSMNAASPSPAGRRPSSMLRSPTKSPTKQLAGSTATSASSTRVGTPSSRAPSTSTSAAGARRTSMAPPPTKRTSILTRPGAPATGTGSTRPSVTRPATTPATTKPRTSLAPRLSSRPGLSRPSRQSDDSGADTGVDTDGAVSPVKNDRLSPDKAKLTPTVKSAPRSPVNTAANREIEDLKTKLRLMEKKRMEDRDKFKALEKVQAERDKFESIIQKLQAKYQPQQQEITDLRKQIKEAESRFEQVEQMQADHEISLEMATLDREMAEETAEVLKAELEALKLRTEELELEVEVLREENTELGTEMSPEERSSHGWLQMEKTNERLREALLRLRDMTEQQEDELRDQVKSLEEDVRDFTQIKEQYEIAKEKLAKSEAIVEDLRQQLDNALGAEDMIEDLTERNMAMGEQIEELKATIDDLESLKELNDELEINHVEAEKEMQEEIDFKDTIISEQARRAAQQEEALEDMEYTLSRFRELVSTLQNDLEDIKASHAVTETESEQLTSRTKAMEDLNMKLQLSAAKTQVKAIDLELRQLDAQQASEHLEIVKLFLPDAYVADRDAVLALLRFKRVGFKAKLLHNFVKDKSDDVYAAADVLDKLVWVSAMSDRFVNFISHCTIEQFEKYEVALYELEPVERAFNGWIDALRRDELKERQCADELKRTIAVMSHLAEVLIGDGLATYADDIHMRTLLMQSHLENSAASLSSVRTMVQTIAQGDEEVAQQFTKKLDAVISQSRSAKVVVSKAVRSLEDLKLRSLTLSPETIETFEVCESGTEELSEFSRKVGEELFSLLHEEGRTEPYTYNEVQTTIHRTTLSVFTSTESDSFSAFANKLRTLMGSLGDLVSLATDLGSTVEFEKPTAPWILRAQQLKSSKTVTVDTEEEMRRLKDDNHERARLIAMKDQTLEEAAVKIETLESRMRDATKKSERLVETEKVLEQLQKREQELAKTLEVQNKELSNMEADRERWKKIAGEHKALGDAGTARAGQERAVATAREMDALKIEISGLQAAVRHLRDDNKRIRMEPNQPWLEAPLMKPRSVDQRRKALVVSEGEDVLNELLNLASTASVYDLSAKRVGWRPMSTTPQYHVAKQKEDFVAWKSWHQSVDRKCRALVRVI